LSFIGSLFFLKDSGSILPFFSVSLTVQTLSPLISEFKPNLIDSFYLSMAAQVFY
jgi:hypothetical protein